MRRNLRNCSARSAHQWTLGWLSVVSCLLLIGTGCESFQKKFIRKSKKPLERPTPIVNFQDYTHAMTPMDRYRNHALMFDYWNGELVDALGPTSSNSKRIKRASAEALQELKTLQGVLQDDQAALLQLLINERQRLDTKIQQEAYMPSQRDLMRRDVEAQTRQFERQFSWRDVQDHLKPQETSGPVTNASHAN